jgi:hypothetical protein
MTGPPVSLEGRTRRMARTRTAVSVGPRLGDCVAACSCRPGQVVLRNAEPRPWVTRPGSEAAKTVDPGQRVAARAMTIGFGPARGRIPGIHTAGTRGGAPAGEGER